MAFHAPMPSSSAAHHPSPSHHHHLHPSRLSLLRSLPLRLRISRPRPQLPPLPVALSSASYGGNNNNNGDGNNNDNSGGGGDGEAEDGDGHRGEALFILAQLGRNLETLPVDLASAIEGGRVTPEIVRRFAKMEASPLLRWLMRFRGFRERLLTDDLFLAKLAMECGVGLIAKNAAELEKRRENFVMEIDVVVSDVEFS